ncbi:response regulator [Chitinophaga niabensis]|uniref:Response regulator receiver domain-containing protein n=1 Tax=Chitinophaga niabensis TaxID=536979 RepID=A0A1N6JCQ4_9BACT|nr:response regulator [Chitinophaga niabensis]SIO42065.1 Response regulator receiver domain-containing protein [Chitinophaga niabensis]
MKKILVIEDDLLMIRVLELILKREGFDTELALNGKEAILNLVLNDYDLVLIDLKLPFEDLREMADQIRRSQEARPFPIMVIILGAFMETAISDWFGLEADEFITKPFVPQELARKVNRLLNVRRLQN